MQSHFSSITPPQPIEVKDKIISTAVINNADIDAFDINKLEEIIQTFTNKKVAGIDGQCTPSQWTKSKIIWIPKPGKDTYKVFKSWRPISLLNQPLKVMAKMIAR